MDVLTPGTVLDGRYEIGTVLGRGGFATVFAAQDLKSGRRDVAVKLLDEAYDQAARARFAREARVLRNLRNPHTVRMLGSGQTDHGRLYIVSELVGGEDLSRLIERAGSLDERAVVHILQQLLESLREAHDLGLLHRDVKPENVRVFRSEGNPYTVKLLDFGLARHNNSGHPSVTKTGELLGTPRYMSPEQLRDQTLTARSDLYSVGLLGIELLVGRDALHGNRWSDQLDRLRPEHVFSAPQLAGVSPGLQEVLARMTTTDPGERYPSAQATLDALDGLRGEPVLKPEPRTRQGGVNVRKSGINWALPGVLIVVLAGIGLAVMSLRNHTPPTPPPLPPQPRPNTLIRTSPADSGRAVPDVATDLQHADSPHGDRSSAYGRLPPFTGEGELTAGVVEIVKIPAYIPSAYDRYHAHPIVILLHPWRDSGDAFIGYSGFSALAEEHRFIVVAPNDFKAAPMRHHSDHRAERARAVRNALEIASEQLFIDRSRVYVVAQGGDGPVAALLSCERWVTAVATNSFRLLTTNQPLCGHRMRPYLLLSALHSKVDPADGGIGRDGCSMIERLSIEQMEERFRERYGCAPKPASTFTRRDGECRKWQCDEPFMSCRLAGGHPWPGGPDVSVLDGCDGTAPDFPTAEVIWSFFQEQSPLQE